MEAKLLEAGARRIVNEAQHLGSSGSGGARVIQLVGAGRGAPPQPKRPPRTKPVAPRPIRWLPSAEADEDDLLQKPLVLLGRARPGSGTPQPSTVLSDPSRRCFASHWAGALTETEAQEAFDRLRTCAPWAELTGKRGNVSRMTCWHVTRGCTCTYTYGTARVCASRRPGAEFKEAMEDLAKTIFTRLWPWMPPEHWPNCANLNLYTSTGQSIGWHADDEMLFMGREHDCPIVSVSLGAQREFWMALRRTGDSMEPVRNTTVEVDLRHGDILTMEGLCQKHCVHFVPCDARFTPPSFAEPSEQRSPGEPAVHPRESVRINVTFRWIRNHKQRCKLRETQALHEILPLFCEQAVTPEEAIAASSQPPTHAQDWAGGRPVIWRSCEGCDHDGWKGGRNCLRHEGWWLCRRCWARARELGRDGLHELPTDPEAAAERKRLKQLRALEARGMTGPPVPGAGPVHGGELMDDEGAAGVHAAQGASLYSHWACPQCAAGNWACREACRGCGAQRPRGGPGLAQLLGWPQAQQQQQQRHSPGGSTGPPPAGGGPPSAWQGAISPSHVDLGGTCDPSWEQNGACATSLYSSAQGCYKSAEEQWREKYFPDGVYQ